MLATWILWLGFAAGTAMLCAAWQPQLGLPRALGAAICRAIWLVPLFSLLYPKSASEPVANTARRVPLHIFVDDSNSVVGNTANNQQLGRVMETLDAACQRYNCAPRYQKLSLLSPKRVRDGFSPLADTMEAWKVTVADDPWILLSDGGDELPLVPWAQQFSGFGRGALNTTRGAVLGIEDPQMKNYWISRLSNPTLAFQEHPVRLQVALARSSALKDRERVQVQVEYADRVLTSANAEFLAGDQQLEVELSVPALNRSTHLLKIRLLPTATEEVIWDNDRYLSLEVQANTIGVLHLLGAPSVDGRFMRRFLKGEPKYDLISFYILRDPWDMQQAVNERELSLIPFPVKRLFEDELNNFRAVVLQNFALHQFLDQAYQDRLVQYVLDGGSMLFLGGERALQPGDIQSSSFAKLLPFDVPGGALGDSDLSGGGGLPQMNDSNFSGPGSYDDAVPFHVDFAKPTDIQRSLASIYDEWQERAQNLREVDGLKGLHRLDKMTFKKDSFTPLLTARLDDGSTRPLAVASYPGKGRVVWIFSDSLWRMAMTSNERVPRQSYDTFLQSTMSWLVRDELRKPLTFDHLRFRPSASGKLQWRVDAFGPAVRYFSQSAEWQLSLCGVSLGQNYSIERIQNAGLQLYGSFNLPSPQPKVCTLELRGEHRAFGSLQERIAGLIPQIYSDEQVRGSWQRLDEFAELTKATFLSAATLKSVRGPETNLDEWVRSNFAHEEEIASVHYRTWTDHYWLFKSKWIYLFLLFLPLEVLVRRWRSIAGG